MVKFENPSNGRFYYMHVEKGDLFDDMVLVVIRGGKSNKLIRHYGFDCQIKINREIDRISRIREKRGYVRVY